MKTTLALLAIQSVHVLAKPCLPTETVVSVDNVRDSHKLAVQPTTAPHLDLVKRRLEDHQKRQASSSSSYLYSYSDGELLGFTISDNTCGYIAGQVGKSS